jgi:hypothetical protein
MTANQTSQRRPARLLHHLARTGGTLISRCLASMSGIVVLSEVHPAAAAIHYPIYDALDQARRWYGLLDAAECARFGRTTPERFAEAIALIDGRCRDRGLTLVLRDWSHLDFVGVPFRRATGRRLETVAVLAPMFDVASFATVRHPIDQWLSLKRFLGDTPLALEDFLAGNRAFAEQAAAMGFVRYEDFVAQPATELARIADAFDLAFDPTFLKRWSAYRNMTGDPPAPDETAILPQRPRRFPPGLADRFLANDDYRRTIGILGYEHRH